MVFSDISYGNFLEEHMPYPALPDYVRTGTYKNPVFPKILPEEKYMVVFRKKIPEKQHGAAFCPGLVQG